MRFTIFLLLLLLSYILVYTSLAHFKIFDVGRKIMPITTTRTGWRQIGRTQIWTTNTKMYFLHDLNIKHLFEHTHSYRHRQIQQILCRDKRNWFEYIANKKKWWLNPNGISLIMISFPFAKSSTFVSPFWDNQVSNKRRNQFVYIILYHITLHYNISFELIFRSTIYNSKITLKFSFTNCIWSIWILQA